VQEDNNGLVKVSHAATIAIDGNNPIFCLETMKYVLSEIIGSPVL
jgi:hypothetical protein